MTPGLYNIPEAKYQADPCPAPSLSSSIAKILLTQSPLHAWTAHPRLNPACQSEEKTAFDLGSAAHALLLEGEDRMVQIDAKDYRTKDAQTARDDARLADKHPILIARYPDVQKMRNAALQAIAACTDLSGYTLAVGLPEHTLIWQEGEIWCRCKPDSLANDHTLILDYKSTTDASPAAFNRQIERMDYHIQTAFYTRGAKALFGIEPKFIFLAQETTEPYSCSFHACAPSLMDIACMEVERAIQTWRACITADKWPAYPQHIHWAEASPWKQKEIDERQERDVGEHGVSYSPEQLWGKP